VNYLGFPGSMGAPYIDYIIADRTLIRPDDYEHYCEKAVLLPGSYQPNDDSKAIADLKLTRIDLGLPQDGFVFACFNNTFKITPDVFDVWMRLLAAVPGSVLWLLETGPDAKKSLESEARRRGIDPARLVWAPRAPLPDHLARHSLADLFLDTFHYNAHTTASDALWAGLPLITLCGQTFPSRVAASLLRAIDLSELITHDVDGYEQLALALARSQQRLGELRSKLARNRTCTPLFDSARLARSLEVAYGMMWERHARGLAPDHIEVTAQNAQ
jgi:predicted O-linked N-acetylglucosamine transferase (SPINDLY family)